MTNLLININTILSTTLLHMARADDLGNFVWFTDAHYDEFFGTPSAQVHKEGAPCNLGQDSPMFSAYGCGSSPALVTSAISNAAKALSEDLGSTKPDFILYTGDFTRHGTDGLPLNVSTVVDDSVSFVSSLVEEFFPEVPLVQLPAPDLGNNDLLGDYELNVTSFEPCFLGADGRPPQSTNAWLEATATKFRSLFVSDEEAAVFACGGYLNRMATPILLISTQQLCH